MELQLDLRVDPECDRFIADPSRLQQVLFNLINNAIKFTPAGGNVMLRLFVEDDAAVFQVKDTGIGISEPQLPMLFQELFSARYGLSASVCWNWARVSADQTVGRAA